METYKNGWKLIKWIKTDENVQKQTKTYKNGREWMMSQLVILGPFSNVEISFIHLGSYYSSFTIHRSLFIILLFIVFGVSLRFREAFKNFTIHMTLFTSGGKTLFMYFIHFVVNLVYGYSNSRNQFGLTANSCIIIRDTSYRLE
jgi:FtsH-binding integral membrane protein